MNKATIEQKITGFINTVLLDGQGDDLEPDTPLLKLGIIDSLSMVKLVSFINETFEAEIPPEDILPNNFMTIDTITNYVLSIADKITRSST